MKILSKLLIYYVFTCLIYGAWMTAGSFRFHECEFYPNYNMLSEAMAHGRLHFSVESIEDAVVFAGKGYLYSGPFPALLRLPFELTLNRGIPTGVMVIIFCAGVSVLFPFVLYELSADRDGSDFSWLVYVFAAVMLLNGYSLFMVSVPSVHHEAIAAAAFFLAASILLVFRALNRSAGPTVAQSVLIGVCFASCISCRFSYVPALAVLGLYFLYGLCRRRKVLGTKGIVFPTVIVGGITLIAAGGLLAYNYIRFGAFLDFGMHYQQSAVFYDYFKAGHYFRYDHLPLNLWNIFCRLPMLTPHFPFIFLPAYVLRIDSVALMRYHMVNSNELAVSIFAMLPIVLLALVPLGQLHSDHRSVRTERYIVLSVMFMIQVVAICVTVATTARYYYDFLTLLIMMSFIGANAVAGTISRPKTKIGVLAVLSVLISLSVPMNAVMNYSRYILCHSPLVDLFMGK